MTGDIGNQLILNFVSELVSSQGEKIFKSCHKTGSCYPCPFLPGRDTCRMFFFSTCLLSASREVEHLTEQRKMCLVQSSVLSLINKLVDISGVQEEHLERCNMLTRNSFLESRLVCLVCNFMPKRFRFLPLYGSRFSV